MHINIESSIMGPVVSTKQLNKCFLETTGPITKLSIFVYTNFEWVTNSHDPYSSSKKGEKGESVNIRRKWEFSEILSKISYKNTFEMFEILYLHVNVVKT